MSLSLYPIIKKLGEGGFCTTYLATNTLMPSQPYCVVKQLTPTSTDPQVQQLIKDRFKQEAITLENLGKDSNGKVPSLYAYFVERGEFYLIQEYIDGQTLNERVQTQGIFTEIQVRQLLIDILPTLIYVHQWGIVHRDIKPENIMIRRSDNKPILIDFGAVKETMSTIVTASGNTAKSIVIGTPGFMPLEQMSGRPMFASDIYALGLTAIYLLTGKMPTEFETDPYTGNIEWQYLAPSGAQQLVKVLNKAIQPLSRDRYKNAQEMLQDLSISWAPFALSLIGSHIPVHNRSEQTVYVPTPKAISNSGSGRSKSLIAAMIGVTLGGGLIAGVLALGQNFSRKESERDQNNSQPAVTNNKNPAPTSDSKIISNSERDQNNSQPTVANNKNPVTTSDSKIASKSNSTNARSNASSRESTARNTARDPRDTVRDYYSKIHSRNYAGAWDSLPTGLKNDRAVHPNGYNSFLNWWANQVADVEIKQTNLVSQTERDAVVDVKIEYLMREGSALPYLIRYFLVKDDRDRDWTIQKIRLAPNITRRKS